MSPNEARVKALKQFGSVEQTKELAREQRVWMSPDRLWQRRGVRLSGASEVSRVYARSRTHSDARRWGKRRRLQSSECGPAAPAGCERLAESLPVSLQAVDKL
jgi:hypothetical protein